MGILSIFNKHFGERKKKKKKKFDTLLNLQKLSFMNKENSQTDLVAQWRNTDVENPAGPLFISGEYAEAEIIGEGYFSTCGTECSGSITRTCC